MNTTPLIAVAIITNGNGSHLIYAYSQWVLEGFVPGITLYICGPEKSMLDKGIEKAAVIDYVSPSYYRNNFHINDKKRIACEAIDAEYIYLVHDRFLPKPGFKHALTDGLNRETMDFGAVDVDNEDGSPALREIRLSLSAASVDLESALELEGRLTCPANFIWSSEHVALNGGQFFLRKSLSFYLERPLRWMEMEDDVLSHDLRAAQGKWLKDCQLVTLAPRKAPNVNISLRVRLRYGVYRSVCNILAIITGGVSAGRYLDRHALFKTLNRGMVLIDPLHKSASSDFLPSSLEKIMTRARILSKGKSWQNVEKTLLGWKLTGFQPKP
jgi:hypothetical protein